MVAAYAVVDSGTTTSRVRWWQDGQVVWSRAAPAGARDSAVDGHNGKLKQAVGELLKACAAEAGSPPAAVICSGMITSNMGLYEVPHLPAPAGFDDTAGGIVQAVLPEVSRQPICFIPGIRTQPVALELESLAQGDVLRGEEAEVAGLLAALRLGGPCTFLHFGSHHKVIHVGEGGVILGSRTAVTGELLAAVLGHTILKSSTVELDRLELHLEAALAGARACRQEGLGRALFLVRVGEQLAGLPRELMTSYVIGVLAALDVPLLNDPLGVPARDSNVVLYGSGAFPQVVQALLAGLGFSRLILVDTAVADLAAATGAVSLFLRARELGVVE